MRPKALGGYPEITLELWHRDIIAAWRWPEALTRVYEHSTTILHYCAPAEMSSSSTHTYIYSYASMRNQAPHPTLPNVTRHLLASPIINTEPSRPHLRLRRRPPPFTLTPCQSRPCLRSTTVPTCTSANRTVCACMCT